MLHENVAFLKWLSIILTKFSRLQNVYECDYIKHAWP